MTVREAIEKNKTKKIKVGFGVSFVYCDKVNDKTEQEILEQEKWALNTLEHSIHVLKVNRNNIFNSEGGVEGWIKNELTKFEIRSNLEGEKREQARKNLLNRVQKYAYGMDDRIAEREMWLKTFTHFLDREVTEEYKSIYPNTVIILAKEHGYRVNGRFWDVDEYRQFRRKNK